MSQWSSDGKVTVVKDPIMVVATMLVAMCSPKWTECVDWNAVSIKFKWLSDTLLNWDLNLNLIATAPLSYRWIDRGWRLVVDCSSPLP